MAEEKPREEVLARLAVEVEELKLVRRWLEESKVGKIYAQVGSLFVEVDKSRALELIELRISSLLKALKRLEGR
ncbi:MAG: prefoldin subunit [Desulfurococcales archaeon]|nr:prefoldin subunit [Desulfurococcales archaeon]